MARILRLTFGLRHQCRFSSTVINQTVFVKSVPQIASSSILCSNQSNIPQGTLCKRFLSFDTTSNAKSTTIVTRRSSSSSSNKEEKEQSLDVAKIAALVSKI